MRKPSLTPLLLLIAALLASASKCPESRPLKSASGPPAGAPVKMGEPSYQAWQTVLSKYHDEGQGMDYGALKKNDLQLIRQARNEVARVELSTLSKNEQLAYWINLYNVNVVSLVTENYPIGSIKDLSTDVIKRLNVFDKPVVAFGTEAISLNEVENSRIREGYQDPRIHFAINCAAESCPPVRGEPYTGAKVDQQLDDQTRKFLEGPNGVKVSGSTLLTTPIMKWFSEDFDKWGGGQLAFIRKHVGEAKQKEIESAGSHSAIKYSEYSWKLNDRKKP